MKNIFVKLILALFLLTSSAFAGSPVQLPNDKFGKDGKIPKPPQSFPGPETKIRQISFSFDWENKG